MSRWMNHGEMRPRRWEGSRKTLVRNDCSCLNPERGTVLTEDSEITIIDRTVMSIGNASETANLGTRTAVMTGRRTASLRLLCRTLPTPRSKSARLSEELPRTTRRQVLMATTARLLTLGSIPQSSAEMASSSPTRSGNATLATERRRDASHVGRGRRSATRLNLNVSGLRVLGQLLPC